MIQPLEETYIFDIVLAHKLAWQHAFRGILSDELLDKLSTDDFLAGWKHNLHREGRTNLIYVDEDDKAVGFVSYGKPRDSKASESHEIYGIYVHPEYWGKQIGSKLMASVLEHVQQEVHFKALMLWVMTENSGSRAFYEKNGFRCMTHTRMSVRNDEQFEEVKYYYA